jgi:DNA-binding MarR family transcriptional regulator
MTGESIQPGASVPAEKLPAEKVLEDSADVTFLVWLAARATSGLMDSVLAGSGLTGDEFAVYSMLSATSGVTPSELSRWMAAPPTTVSSYVKRFEARGHVQRDADPQDRRSYRIRLTAEGVRKHEEAARLFAPVRSAVSAGLGDRHDSVREALLTLRPVLDSARADR